MRVHKVASVLTLANGTAEDVSECERDIVYTNRDKQRDWKRVTCLRCLAKRKAKRPARKRA